MPRSPRIQFAGASYHVMARGNHRNKIVFGDDDRLIFERTLDEVALKTGWEIFCWVLMENHYHLVFRTPQPNLVKGMSWFQQTFTQRINARNRLRGHLFAGRYKAILVENEETVGSRYRSDYLANLIQYVHLNPGRAGLVDGVDKSILDYQWSSLAKWYGMAPSRRPRCAMVVEGLDVLGFKDTVAGRRKYIAELDETIRAEKSEMLGITLPEGQSLQSTLERGWYWGSAYFKEGILEKFSELVKPRQKEANEASHQIYRDHAEKTAGQILQFALHYFQITLPELINSPYPDQIRPAIAAKIADKTTLSYHRIAEILNMKSRGNVSQQISQFRRISDDGYLKNVKQFMKKSSFLT